jgi:hypothetical protein
MDDQQHALSALLLYLDTIQPGEPGAEPEPDSREVRSGRAGASG